MPRPKPTRSPRRGSSRPPSRGGSRASGVLLGLVLGVVVAGGAFWLYQRTQQPRKFPTTLSEQRSLPLGPASPRRAESPSRPAAPTEASGRIATGSEAAPFGISEDVFEAGARLYSSRCASCHGTPQHIAAGHSTAVQLWRANHAAGGTGVSHQSPAAIYRSVAGGAPTAGMPAYRGVLTSTQLWQLSLLLSNAGQEMPDPVVHLLDAPKP